MEQSRSESFRSSLAGGHTYVLDHCCSLCEQDELQEEAVGYCVECQDYLCRNCYRTHLKPKPMSHHNLLDQHQMPKDQQQNRGEDTCTEACTVHPYKILEYFCNKHGKLGCAVCMEINHRNCGFEHIPYLANNKLNKKMYLDIQTKISSLAQVANIGIQTSQDEAKCSKTYHSNALEDFKQFKQDLFKTVDRIEKSITEEADIIKGNDEKKMILLENKYKNILKDIQTLSSSFTRLQNNGLFCQMFIAMKRTRLEIAIIETRIRDLEQNVKARNYRLITSNEVQLLLDSPERLVKLEEMNQSGSNSTQTATSDEPSLQFYKRTVRAGGLPSKHNRPTVGQQGAKPSVSQLKTPASPGPAAVQHSRDDRKTRTQHIMDIQVRSNDDKATPWITGCVVLPGDKRVVVDYNNNNVKLIDPTHNNVVSQLELSCKFWDITQVGVKQVAVTSYNTQTICVVHVGANQLKLDRRIKVKGNCRGIASINDKLVVSYDEPVKVEIISLKGKVLQTIVTEDIGSQLFTRPLFAAVSKNQQTIFISDEYRDTVTSIDITGQVQATYKDVKLLVKPRGLTIDNAGRVYVCGWDSRNILQLTADLTEVQELLQKSDELGRPESVYYCEASDNLCTGMWKSDVVKVYHLK